MTRPVDAATQLKASVANLLAQREAAKAAAVAAQEERDKLAAQEEAKRASH